MSGFEKTTQILKTAITGENNDFPNKSDVSKESPFISEEALNTMVKELTDWIDGEIFKQVMEDHEKVMTQGQMNSHIKTLFNKADDKDAFLKVLSKYSEKEDCTEKDFSLCAKQIEEKGKEYTDEAIHALEKEVGYKAPTLKETLFSGMAALNINPTKGSKGVQGKIDSVYSNKKVSKSKKKFPKLKKNVYGTGFAPSGWTLTGGGDGSDAANGSGDAGGGDGGGSGG